MSEWFRVGRLSDISVQGARVALLPHGRVAIFLTKAGEIFAIEDQCPHRQGPLSEGLVHEHWVTCPLHAWSIDLRTGEAAFPDKGCVKRYDVRIDGDFIFVGAEAAGRLTPLAESISRPSGGACAVAPGSNRVE